MFSRPTNPHAAQAAADRNAYIPPAARQAMERQMEHAVPTHLKKYVGSDKPGFVPTHVEQALTESLQKTMPAHLQQYAGAYVQQNIVQPSAARPAASATSPYRAPRIPDQLNQSHSGDVSAEQANARFLNLFPSDNPSGGTPGSVVTPASPYSAAPATGAAPEAAPPPTSQDPYNFIFNPSAAPKKSLFGGGNSTTQRLLVVAAGLVVLLIAAIVFANVLGGGSNTTSFLTIAQEQNELIRVANVGAPQIQSAAAKNFVTTTQLALTSDQQQLLAYMGQNGAKVNPKQLVLAQNSMTDKQLSAAQSVGNYDSTLVGILQTQLKDYSSELQRTYKQAKGPVGRQLLSDEYDHAQLLLQQSQTKD